MTNIEQLVAEMELGHTQRVSLAAEIEQLRRLASECRRHYRRLPPLVQNAMRAPVRVYDVDPPPDPRTSPRLV